MFAMLLLLGEYRSHSVVKASLKCLSFCMLIVYFYAFAGSLNFCSYYAEKTCLDRHIIYMFSCSVLLSSPTFLA